MHVYAVTIEMSVTIATSVTIVTSLACSYSNNLLYCDITSYIYDKDWN